MGENKIAHSSSFAQEGFPVHALPPRLKGYVIEAAQALGVVVDMLAVPALVVASAAIGASRHIRIKDRWTEHAVVYVAVVAPTGALKSPALQAALFPVVEQQVRFEKAAMERAVEVQKKPGDEPPPPSPRTWTSDVTVEALGQLLEANPYGLLLYRDELSGWVKAMDQYRGGKGADRQFFLSAWSGAPISTDRVGRPSIRVPHPFLSVVGTIPPDILSDLTDEHGREDGFLPRVLFAFPEQLPVRWSSTPISQQARKNYAHLLWEIYALEFENDPATGEPGPMYLPLSPEATQRFSHWHDVHCQQMEDRSLSPAQKGFFSKLKGYCARLALIHALCIDPTTKTVGVASVEAAITMVDYFKQQAAKVCAHLAQPKKTPMERCEREIRRNLASERILTKRELQQGGNAEASVFNTILRELIASGQIKETQRQGKKGLVKAYELAT